MYIIPLLMRMELAAVDDVFRASTIAAAVVRRDEAALAVLRIGDDGAANGQQADYLAAVCKVERRRADSFNPHAGKTGRLTTRCPTVTFMGSPTDFRESSRA